MSSTLDEEEDGGRWQGYSDYQTVSIRAAKSIDDAISAYATIRGLHAQGARIQPELAAEAHGRMLGAVLKVVPEMRQDRNEVDLYDEILTEWEGDGGRLKRLRRVDLYADCPEWLQDMMLQLRRAGWELGYLQAGQRDAPEPEDQVEAEARSMFS